ncbi:MAG: hypothetical protein IPG55_05165 [Saprospiraceae bacterium]|nr:hypothetical protein [Candidatus Defluviibacterium haderslevense]
MVDFYKLVVKLIGDNLDAGKTRFENELSANNGFEAVTNFLDTIKPQIDALVEQNNLQQIFIIPKKFNNNLQAKLQKHL